MVSLYIKRMILNSNSKLYIANDKLYAFCSLLFYLCLFFFSFLFFLTFRQWGYHQKVTVQIFYKIYFELRFKCRISKLLGILIVKNKKGGLILFYFLMNNCWHFRTKGKKKAIDSAAVIEIIIKYSGSSLLTMT